MSMCSTLHFGTNLSVRHTLSYLSGSCRVFMEAITLRGLIEIYIYKRECTIFFGIHLIHVIVLCVVMFPVTSFTIVQ